jgi:PAS domain S-box-containing protein
MHNTNHSGNDKYLWNDLFLEHSPGLAWVMNEHSSLVYANPAFLRYFELTDHAFNFNISDVLPVAIGDMFYSIYLQVAETGINKELTDELKKRDGTASLFHITGFLIVTQDGEKLVAGYAANLINEYSSEIKLREANEQLLLFKQNSADAIWEWDLRTGTIYRNDILMKMIGYRPEKEQGLAWWLRRIHPEDRDLVSEKIKNITDHGEKTWEIEYRLKCADDTYKLINDHGFAIYENGFPVKLAGSLKDISTSA